MKVEGSYNTGFTSRGPTELPALPPPHKDTAGQAAIYEPGRPSPEHDRAGGLNLDVQPAGQ